MAQKISATRRKNLLKRLKDCDGLCGWKAALEKVERSEFCRGKNDRGWKADFDFMVRESSFIKLMEGKYDGKQRTRTDENREKLSEWVGEQPKVDS